MSSVWLLIHDDRHYDMGDTFVRGAYTAKLAADEAIVTRTASGRPSRAWSAHDEHCCSVEEFELLGDAVIDVREDDPPLDPNAPRIIPDSVADMTIELAVREFPAFEKLRRG